MKTKKLFAVLAVAVLVILPMIAFGQTIDPKNNPFGFIDPASGIPIAGTPVTDLGGIVINLVNWFAWFIAVASVAMGLYSGLLFITARGETAQLSTARKTLTYAMIGIAVAVFSFSIITVTQMFLL